MIRNERQKPIQIGNYILRTTIGKGYSAIVKLATHVLTGQKVAIKLFDRSALDNDIEKTNRLKREIESMKCLKHANIIKLYEVMETPKLVYLVTEFASNGDLCDFIINNKRLSEREARYYFKQIVQAVDYCHKKNIVHRDIKIENLLLDSQFQIKLADFGFSCKFNQGELLDVWCGSPPYCAPELFLAELYDGPKVDIWSCGVVLYILVCRRFPFDATSYNKLRSQVISGYYTTPFFLSEECKNLIRGMLTVNPMERLSMKDILNHIWFRIDTEFESRNLINEIEQFTINESNTLQLDENVLCEIRDMGINVDLVLESLRQQKFDDKQALYSIIEDKIRQNQLNSSNHLERHVRRSLNTNNSTDENDELHGFTLEKHRNIVNFVDNKIIEINDTNTNTRNSQDSGMNTADDNEVIDEELNRYLNTKGALRRHTIGTNNPDKLIAPILNEQECLLAINQQNNYNTNNFLYNNQLNILNEINQADSGMNVDYFQQNQHQAQLQQNQLVYQQLCEFNKIFENALAEQQQQQIIEQVQQQQQQQQQPIFVSPTISYRRRTSDGGSNITLFNQQFASYRQSNTNNTYLGSTASSLQQSRGSITSGTPIKMPSFDDDSTASFNNNPKKQKTRIRHEPYTSSHLVQTSSDETYKSHHRCSEPNHFDIIRNYRNHYEQLYNQTIQSELKNLQKSSTNTINSTTTVTPTSATINAQLAYENTQDMQQQLDNQLSSNEIQHSQTSPVLSSTPSSSSTLLHMIKEEQNDMISSSTTPRLSQTSTIPCFDDHDFTQLMNSSFMNQKIPEELVMDHSIQHQQRRYSMQLDFNKLQQQQQQQLEATNTYYSYYPPQTQFTRK